MACYGYIDEGDWTDGGAGGVPCSVDSDCPSGQECDDWSGWCVAPSSGSGTGYENVCDDGVDDDSDGNTDCEDSDCAYAEPCNQPEICQNGADDDMDGYLDCEDPDCPACPETETWCGNLVDDDLDGLLDCDDPDCVNECELALCGDGTQSPTEECDDGDLVGGDGCSATCELELDVFCDTLTPLVLGVDPSDNIDGTNAFSSSCIPAGGRERAFSFTAVADGTLSVSVASAFDVGVYVLLGCSASATEAACSADGASIDVPLLAGTEVTVVVDGATAADVGAFSISAGFATN